ncbi:MAG: hypothetical protein Q9205_002746 [Flavoplaca limonia]
MAGTQDMHPAPSLSTLPTEIVSEVYSYLHKEDLKIVRLSCHRLDEITRPILFDKVVITSLGNNASLFDCVVDNPQLAQYVKTLVVDVLRFRCFSAAYYIKHLIRQLEHDVARHLPAFALTPPAAVLFKKLRKAKWFKNRTRTRDRTRALAVFDLDHSYDTYIAVHDSQKGCVGSSLSRCVAMALSKCVKVQELEVQTEWLPYDRPVGATLESLLPRFSSSGMVARHHNPLLLRPMPPKEDELSHWRFLLQLFNAVDKVTTLKLGKGVVTVQDQLDTLEPLGFQHLANLTVWIPATFSPDVPIPVNRLTLALQNARTLKQLNIGCSNTTSFEHVDMFRLRLLPLLQSCFWPQLDSLKLYGMVASARDLSSLLEGHKGFLRRGAACVMYDKVMSEHQGMGEMRSNHRPVVKHRKYLADVNYTGNSYNMECTLAAMCCANQAKAEASLDTETACCTSGSDTTVTEGVRTKTRQARSYLSA